MVILKDIPYLSPKEYPVVKFTISREKNEI